MNDDDDVSFIEMLGNDAFYKLVFGGQSQE